MPRLLVFGLAAALVGGAAVNSAAQCASCAQPVVAFSPVLQPAPQQVVAFSPVLQPAPQPVVWQSQTTTREGWYPGKLIGGLFRRPTTTTTVTAVAPQPQVVGFAPTHTVGFAPTHTVGFAPQAASFAPSPTAFTAAYRPTYPPSYTVGFAPTFSLASEVALQTAFSPVVGSACSSCNACGCDPCGCTSCAMPVTMASPGCSTCGQATSAVYESPSSGCASCNAPASYSSNVAPSNYYDSAPTQQSYNPQSFTPQTPGQPTPAPGLGPNENPPAERSILEKPEMQQDDAADLGPSAADSSTYFEAPQLYDPRDRTTQRPTAPVWNAVYEKPADGAAVRRTSMKVASEPQAPVRRSQVGFEGWSSVGN